MRTIILTTITAFLTSGCASLMSANEAVRFRTEKHPELVLLELKDPRGTIMGLNGIFINFEKKTYGINDRVASFSDCEVDENATLRFICLVIDLSQGREDKTSTDATTGDVCRKTSLRDLLRGRTVAQEQIYGEISGIITCSDSLTDPSTKISVVVLDKKYVEAIYVDNFDLATGEIVQSQAYISIGSNHFVKSGFRFE